MIATIILTALIIVICTSIIIRMIKNKKNGKNTCGCGCSSCANSSICHQKK